jgi:hypothetical protein
MICGVFGLAWAQWGASGVSGAASGAIRILGLILGLAIFLWSGRLRRACSHATTSSGLADDSARSLFSSPAYRRVVALEIISLFAGGVLLGVVGHPEYIAAWYATVVGAHFLAFGHLFDVRFYVLGAALIAAGIAGATAGLAGGGQHGVEAVAGLATAASLFVAGGWTVATAR